MKLVNVAVKRPVTIWMFTLAVLLFGMVSLSRLSVTLLPELSYPSLTIRTNYDGAAPAEVEQLVSKPIEEALGVVKGVRNIQSVSRPEQSDVILEFEWGTAMDMASLEVREKLDVLQLPLDIEKPLLLRFNPSLDPIVKLALKAKAEQGVLTDELSPTRLSEYQLKSMREFAEEELKRKLESISGVASVKLGGGLENEVQILVDQHKASQLGLRNEDIVRRLAEENVNQSGGRLDDGTQEFLVRTLNQFTSLADISELFIATVDGAHIRLSDIATIQDGYKERTSITRINGEEAVEIALYKEGDANTVDVAKHIQARQESLKKQLPDGLELTPIYDQSIFISNAISEVKGAAMIGGVLAMLVLFVFLKNIWTTVIISLSIPVSVIATFNLMYGNDISLNIMSLGGIALAIGLLVDNSIVVLENIARHREIKSENKYELKSENGVKSTVKTSAVNGTKEVATAIFASTLTTMAVFFPLAFVEGIAGQLFSDQALTVTFALLASLVVALTLIPMLAANSPEHESSPEPANSPEQSASKDNEDDNYHLEPLFIGMAAFKSFNWKQKIGYILGLPFKLIGRICFYYLPLTLTLVITSTFRLGKLLFTKLFAPVLWLFDKAYNAIAVIYKRLLKSSLQASKVSAVVILLIAAGAVATIPRIGVELIPPLAQGEFIIEVTQQPGTPLLTTDQQLNKLSQVALKNAHVERTYSLAGTGSLMNASPAQGGDHWGRLNVVLKVNTSAVQEQQVIESIRQQANRIPGLQVKIAKPELFTFKPPLQIELASYELESLKKYSAQLLNKLEQNGNYADITTSLLDGQPEIKVYFDHARLAQLGLTAPQISQLISTKIGGDIASQYSINDRKIDILVRVTEDDRNSFSDIENLIVNPQSASPVPLSAVARLELSVGPSEITRIEQQRVAVISANFIEGDLAQAALTAQTLVSELNLPYNVQARITGQNEEMDVSFTSLKFALAIAIFLVYLVMASQFESLLHPLLILFTVPLAGAGSLYGLYLTDTHISVIVFIGLIMLAGIVVNNAIILVDRINQLRAQGTAKLEAISLAAASRLRPILMTSLTTTLGLLPLAISTGEGSEIRAPMAITVIFGLLFSTVLTLVFIPVIYNLFDRKKFAQVKTKSADTDAISDADIASTNNVTMIGRKGEQSHV